MSWREQETTSALLKSIQTTCTPLAFLVHFFLIFLILEKSPKSLGAYRYLLIYISLFELLYASLDVLVSPELFTVGSAFMLVVDANKTFLPFGTLYPILLLFCGMLGYSMAIFTISFVYRFLVVKGSHLLKSFDSPKLLIWIVSPLPYAAVWMTITAMTLKGNRYTDKMLEEHFLRGVPLSQVVYIGPNYYPTADRIDWIPIIGMAVLTMMIFASIYSIVHFAAKSYLLMNALVSSSSCSKSSLRHRATQSQLLNALVLQALIPFFLMHLPASFVFIMPFFERGEQVFATVFSVTVALYPVLDPLPTIFVVKYYRIALFEYCSRIGSFVRCSKKATAVVSDYPSSTVYHLSPSPV